MVAESNIEPLSPMETHSHPTPNTAAFTGVFATGTHRQADPGSHSAFPTHSTPTSGTTFAADPGHSASNIKPLGPGPMPVETHSHSTPSSAFATVTGTQADCPRELNKHELLIAPNEHSIVDDALLRCTPYIVDTKYKVLICTCCQHSVNPDRARDHLHKYHPHCKVQKNFAMSVRTKFPGLVCESIQPLEVIKPVFGLAIPIEPYTICARCRRGYANISSWRCHACGNAGANLAGRPDHFSSLVQTFFRGTHVCYFPIQPPVSTPVNEQGNDFDLFKSCFEDLPISPNKIEEPDDYRELNQFLLKEGWIDHVKGNSQTELSFLTAPPRDGEIFKPIALDVVTLMRNLQIAIGTAGYHVRRLLGKRPT